MKTIVTHISPDLDAHTACWLIKRFLPGWKDAHIKYVGAGLTLSDAIVDSDEKIIHVDTGMGRFDHHQTDNYTCAAKLVYDFLLKEGHVSQKIEEALKRLVNFVNETDHFKQAYYPEADSDRYDFCLHQIIEGLKNVIKNENEMIEYVFKLLDTQLQILRNKVGAEEEIKKGFVFQSKWGKTLVMETKNSEAINLALKMHFHFVAKKDPVKGNIRIKTLPDKKLDLTPLYKEIVKKDKKATWFLHVSKNMLLNGSAKNSKFIPSRLSASELIAIIKSI